MLGSAAGGQLVKAACRVLLAALTVLAAPVAFVRLALQPLQAPTGPHAVCSTLRRLPRGCLYRVFAPTAGGDSRVRGCWLPAPFAAYTFGLSVFLQIPLSLVRYMLSSLLVGVRGAWLDCEDDETAHVLAGQWPLVLFSHGIGGTSTMYSSLCCELASHRMIVVAVEHTDGSACATVTLTLHCGVLPLSVRLLYLN